MPYEFPLPHLNPRPDLSDEWRLIGREELISGSPSCAGAFLRQLEENAPQLAAELVFLRHPQDRDCFAVRLNRRPFFAIQFDIDMEYIIPWSLDDPERWAEIGDWGDGEETQAKTAVEYVLELAAAP